MARRVVRERIDPNITASLFSNYRNSTDAILELIDNAVDSRIDGQTLNVEVRLQPQSLTVFSTGGEGMDDRDIERRYLRWGASLKRGDRHLGRYGQGGKAAIGHLGHSFLIEAGRPGSEDGWRFADPEYRDRSRLKTYEVEQVRRRSPLGYVWIRVSGVDRKIESRQLEDRLAETYRPLLDDGRLTLTLGGRSVTAAALPLADRRSISVNAGGRRIQGWFGLLDSDAGGAGWKPGLRCYQLGRLVAEGELFGHPGPAQVPSVARLIGELEITGVPLTMNKTDFERDSAEWEAVESRLHGLLAPVMKRLAKDPEPPPPAAAVKIAAAVRRLLGQALKASDRRDLFAGTTHGDAAPEGDALPLLDVPQERARQARDAGPPSAPRASRPGSGRGFGNVVVRPLDARIRWLLTQESGNETIVINSRYPLFEERHGDLLYQLETAARAVAAGVETDVAAYERRVHEIVVMALSLRRRRRKAAGRQLRLVR